MDSQSESAKTFGAYLKELRLRARIGLREFARLIDKKPSNYSNWERGKIDPPTSEGDLTEICDNLGLETDSEERRRLFDLAATTRKIKRVPADVEKSLIDQPGMALLVRTINDVSLDDERLRELAEHIKKNL